MRKTFPLCLIAAVAVQASTLSILDDLKKCRFARSGGRGFLDQAPKLDYTVHIKIDVPTRAMAEEAFKYVAGDPASTTFWGRWDRSELAFDYDERNSSFTMYDADTTRFVSDFRYDAVNSCHRLDSNVTGIMLPKGVYATSQLASVVVQEETGKFAAHTGSFNCVVSNKDEALRQKFCLTVATLWPNINIHFIECLLANYKDNEEGIRNNCNNIIMPGITKNADNN